MKRLVYEAIQLTKHSGPHININTCSSRKYRYYL